MIFFVLGLPLIAGMLVFVLPTNRWRNAVLFCAAWAHVFCVVGLWLNPSAVALNGFLALDPFGRIILSVLSVLFLSVACYVPGYVGNEEGRSNHVFTGCLLFLLFSMTLVTVSRHFGLFWVAIEATTLTTAPLINFHRRPQGLDFLVERYHGGVA